MASITCGNCEATAVASADSVRACYAGDVVPCGWQVEVPGHWVDYEDGIDWIEARVVPCGAHTVIDDRGWACENGHSYVSMEVRHAEGWEYAEDDDEAKALARAGVAPADLVTGAPYRLGA